MESNALTPAPDVPVEEALDQAGNASESAAEDLRTEVVRRHLGLARSLAQRYAGRGIDTDDLRQVACLGLLKAARGFDSRRGGKFVSYAVPTIRGELKRHFRDHGWTIRPPRRIQELQGRISAVTGSDLAQRLGRPPTLSEIAERLDADVADVSESLAAEGCFTPTSLDALRPSGVGSLGDDLGQVDGNLDAIEDHVDLQRALTHLDERDREIVRLRFVEDLTQEEIGRRIGVTQMQVSRILTRIMRELRTELEAA